MKFSALLIVSATLAISFVAPAMAADVPSLVGTWKGPSDGVGTEDGFRTGDVTIVVSEQKGRSFRAKILYPSDDGKEAGEDILGTIAPDGRNVYFVGDEGFHLSTLSGTTLDVCYLEAAEDAFAGCSSLQKQP